MNKNSGFSLVELIVVIAIIAILSTGVAVIYVNHVAEAERNKTLTNCCTVVECTQIIATENKEEALVAPYDDIAEMSKVTGTIEKIETKGSEITYLRYSEKYTAVYKDGKYEIMK